MRHTYRFSGATVARQSPAQRRSPGSQTWDTTVDWKTVGTAAAGDESSQDALKYVDDYVEEKWARGRPVTDVKFSPHQAPMFLAAYGERTSAAASDPDGCMLVWNLAMKNRPCASRRRLRVDGSPTLRLMAAVGGASVGVWVVRCVDCLPPRALHGCGF